jgi:hypothetical protein
LDLCHVVLLEAIVFLVLSLRHLFTRAVLFLSCTQFISLFSFELKLKLS